MVDIKVVNVRTVLLSIIQGLPPPPRPTSASLPTPLEFVEMARRRSTISSLKAATTVKPLPVYKHRRPQTQVGISLSFSLCVCVCVFVCV